VVIQNSVACLSDADKILMRKIPDLKSLNKDDFYSCLEYHEESVQRQANGWKGRSSTPSNIKIYFPSHRTDRHWAELVTYPIGTGGFFAVGKAVRT
jgi:hypothetical protein